MASPTTRLICKGWARNRSFVAISGMGPQRLCLGSSASSSARRMVLILVNRFLTTVGFTCCVMGTWEILLTSNSQALLAGGSAGLFWSVCWAYVGQTFVVLSLAEMSSMAPTGKSFPKHVLMLWSRGLDWVSNRIKVSELTVD